MGVKLVSKEGLTSSLHFTHSLSGESHVSYHRGWTMGHSNCSTGFKGDNNREANHLFCSNMATVSAAFSCHCKVWENKAFYCEVAHSSFEVYHFNGFVSYWLDFKVNIKDFHIVTLIAKILFYKVLLKFSVQIYLCVLVESACFKTASCLEPCSF